MVERCNHTRIYMWAGSQPFSDIDHVASQNEANIIYCAECGQIKYRLTLGSEFKTLTPLVHEALETLKPEDRKVLDRRIDFIKRGE